MHQQISKKIIIYLLLFFLFVTINNYSINKFIYPKVNFINISGLNLDENQELLNNLNYLKSQNLFFIDKEVIQKNIMSNNYIENFSIFKKYPSTLEINIQKTKFLGIVNKKGINFLIGSNGKFIKTNTINKDLPFIFGNFESKDFLELKSFIDKSHLDFYDIKKLYFYPSGRWDIETIKEVTIKLPKHDLDKYINLSVQILRKNDLNNIKVIDLRQKNQVILDEKK